MQKNAGEYEVIIGDDCSPDNTREIIEDYQEKYPAIIKPILREVNIGARNNLMDVLLHCNGEYVAYLEGDDYWIDEYKLHKQVEFLENHKDYSAIYHQCKVVDQESQTTMERADWFSREHNYSTDELTQFRLPGQTSTIFYRNFKEDIIQQMPMIKSIKYCPFDRIAPIFLLAKGKIYCSEEIMGAYRYVLQKGGTNWSSRMDLKLTHNYLLFYMIMKEQEKIGRLFGLTLNFKYKKSEFCGKSLYFALKLKKWKCYYMFAVMALLTPQKRSFLKESIGIFKNECRNHS